MRGFQIKRAATGEYPLPLELLYPVPAFEIQQLRSSALSAQDSYAERRLALLDALEQIGPLPTDPRGQRLLTGMEMFWNLTTLDAYRLPLADKELWAQKAEYISTITDGRIIVELGIGGEGGATKTGQALSYVSSYLQKTDSPRNDPWEMVIHDQTNVFVGEAKERLINLGFARKKIKMAAGDIFRASTWTSINKQIDLINRENNQEPGSRGITVLFQGGTHNDFGWEKLWELHNSVFSLHSQDIFFCVGIDNSTDPRYLDGAYNNAIMRQWVLSAVTHFCWDKHISFDPREAESKVLIKQDDPESAKVQFCVTEKKTGDRFVFHPIAKASSAYMREKLDLMGVQTEMFIRYKDREADSHAFNYSLNVLRPKESGRPSVMPPELLL